jgi:hypothetical protein
VVVGGGGGGPYPVGIPIFVPVGLEGESLGSWCRDLNRPFPDMPL